MTAAGPLDQPRQPYSAGRQPIDGEPPAPLVTSCGRLIKVAMLCFGSLDRPFARIALEIGPERGGASRVWAGLHPQEARRLAGLLLEQAARAEREDGGACG
ncbi:hypothetical protein ACIQGZ_20200 [Streptomyces sp. NPDC092296]|uniref:hypothetical protein n=1 Tax=Streptomyces sp. NPDC092296 TaxID=3366012 RepID=UPI003811EED4